MLLRVWKNDHADTEHDGGSSKDEHFENHCATDNPVLDGEGLGGESGTGENDG